MRCARCRTHSARLDRIWFLLRLELDRQYLKPLVSSLWRFVVLSTLDANEAKLFHFLPTQRRHSLLQKVNLPVAPPTTAMMTTRLPVVSHQMAPTLPALMVRLLVRWITGMCWETPQSNAFALLTREPAAPNVRSASVHLVQQIEFWSDRRSHPLHILVPDISTSVTTKTTDLPQYGQLASVVEQ